MDGWVDAGRERVVAAREKDGQRIDGRMDKAAVGRNIFSAKGH